jgi:glyoxylase-like metal-dependent hydrolase (beta-lactamase superfamily II)
MSTLKKLRHGAAALTLLAGTCSAPAHDLAATAQGEVMREYPTLFKAIMRGGSFSSDFSRPIANNMYSKTDAAAIADARAMLKIEPQGPRSWLLRFPFVNVAVFETDAGLVLVDSAYAPAGPALRDALRQISSKPVHTIILSHMHADHAWGAWALLQSGPGGTRPRIVATDQYVPQLGYEMRTFGLIARNNNQGLADVPRKLEDAVLPSLTFHGTLSLSIGGETFVLKHARGETEDQLWVSVPARKVVVSADYYQDFLPNAGNGKRRQRFPDEWAAALRDMAAQNPERLLPMHGAALTGAADVQDRLLAHADMLDSISRQVVDGLNAGLRRDQAVDQVVLAPALAQRADAREVYVSVKDVARMVAKQYGGWWDDLPAHWNPAPAAAEAREVAALAGGVDKLMQRAQALLAANPALAAQLADWAWLAAPDDPAVLRGALAIYGGRIGPETTTQEALVYKEHMVRLKVRLAELAAR